MLNDFELAAKRHEQIKEAFVQLAAKPLAAVAKWSATNPMKALTTAFFATDIGSGAKQLAGSVRKTPVSVPGTFTAGANTF